MLDRILELEAGTTKNEPKQIALQQAFEKVVASLIIEVAELGVWQFADPLAGWDLIEIYWAENTASWCRFRRRLSSRRRHTIQPGRYDTLTPDKHTTCGLNAGKQRSRHTAARQPTPAEVMG